LGETERGSQISKLFAVRDLKAQQGVIHCSKFENHSKAWVYMIIKKIQKHGFLSNAEVRKAERKNKKQMLGRHMVHFLDSNSVDRKRSKRAPTADFSLRQERETTDKYCKCPRTADPTKEHHSLDRWLQMSPVSLSLLVCLCHQIVHCGGHQSVMSSTSDHSKEL
jgi:hypothetical protein